MDPTRENTTQYVVSLSVRIYAKDQAEALRALADAIVEKCGRETIYSAFLEESNVKAAKR